MAGFNSEVSKKNEVVFPEGGGDPLKEKAHSPADSSGKGEFEEPEQELGSEMKLEQEPEPEQEPGLEQELAQELGAEQLREIWDNKLLPEIKKQHKHNIYALLQDGRPFSCKKGIFTVCLPPGYSFNQGRIESTRNKKYLETLLKNLLGHAVDLTVILQEMPEDNRNKYGPYEENTPQEITREVDAGENTAGKNARVSGGAGGAQLSGDGDLFIREMLELFNGKLIEAGGNELKSRDFWSFSIDSVPEETDE